MPGGVNAICSIYRPRFQLLLLLLKYVLSHPLVTCTIAGSTRLEHLEDNQAAGRGQLPDAAGRRRIEQYWDSHLA
jgi:aryl-alcohol dehydrogenase-like predicted oxidoreductase